MENPYCERCGNQVQSRSSLFCYACSHDHPAECNRIAGHIKRLRTLMGRKARVAIAAPVTKR